MKKGKFRRAFTLVELVVVIAVVAILSAVAVGSYFGVTESANKASDQSTITEMNNILKMHQISDGEIRYLTEANEDLKAEGLDLDTYKVKSRNSFIAFDIENTKFLLLDNIENNKNLNYFVPVYSESDIAKYDGYSYYLTKDFDITLKEDELNEDEPSKVLSLTSLAGVDTGINSNIEEVSIEDSKSGNIVLYTNGTNIIFDDSSASVTHYGDTTSCVIKDCAQNSWYEYGRVDVLQVEGGHIVAEEESYIFRTVVEISSESKEIHIDGSKGGSFGTITKSTNIDTDESTVSSNITFTNVTNNSGEGEETKVTSVDSLTETSYEGIPKNNENVNSSIVIRATSDKITYSFESLDSFKEYISSFSNKSKNWILYIKGETTVDTTLELPSNIDLAIDYDTSTLESYLENYMIWKEGSETDTTIKTKKDGFPYIKGRSVEQSDKSSSFTSGAYNSNKGQECSPTNILTITKNGKLIINSILRVEGNVLLPIDNEGSPFTIQNAAQITNNGEIIIKNGGEIWSVGKIIGDGTIAAQSGAKVYELFKYYDWRNGSKAGSAAISAINSSIYLGVFPFRDYYIDNIECKTFLNYGSTYYVIGTLSSYNVSMAIPLIGNSGSIFKMTSSDCLVYKSSKNGKTTIEVAKGTLEDGVFDIYITTGVYVPTNQFYFPLTNLDIIIDGSAKVSLGNGAKKPHVDDSYSTDEEAKFPRCKFILMPNSTITNNGILEIKEGQIAVYNSTTISFPTLIAIDSDDTTTLISNFLSGQTTECAFWKHFTGDNAQGGTVSGNGEIDGTYYEICGMNIFSYFYNFMSPNTNYGFNPSGFSIYGDNKSTDDSVPSYTNLIPLVPHGFTFSN